MEAAAALEGFAREDFRTSAADACFHGVEVVRIKYNQRTPVVHHFPVGVESSVATFSCLKSNVVRPVIGEGPTKKRSVELFRGGNVRPRKFDVVERAVAGHIKFP